METEIRVQVFDPPMCCSTGICGPGVDRGLMHFATTLAWLKNKGIVVERANLGQNPVAFTANTTVIEAMNADPNTLPLVLVNGEIKSRRAYPTREQLAEWCGLEAPVISAPTALSMSGGSQ